MGQTGHVESIVGCKNVPNVSRIPIKKSNSEYLNILAWILRPLITMISSLFFFLLTSSQQRIMLATGSSPNIKIVLFLYLWLMIYFLTCSVSGKLQAMLHACEQQEVVKPWRGGGRNSKMCLQWWHFFVPNLCKHINISPIISLHLQETFQFKKVFTNTFFLLYSLMYRCIVKQIGNVHCLIQPMLT